jgi:hypothetical protein
MAIQTIPDRSNPAIQKGRAIWLNEEQSEAYIKGMEKGYMVSVAHLPERTNYYEFVILLNSSYAGKMSEDKSKQFELILEDVVKNNAIFDVDQLEVFQTDLGLYESELGVMTPILKSMPKEARLKACEYNFKEPKFYNRVFIKFTGRTDMNPRQTI